MLSEARPAVAALAPREPVRASSVGMWWTTERGSALQVDPAWVGDRSALEQVVAVCAGIRNAKLPGLWPVLDLISAHEAVWLLTEAPLRPTFGELLERGHLDPLGAAGALNEVGQTVRSLRRLGWVVPD